jgi:DUF4097 and DUF4098 domain-containing protein YvlB
MKRSIISILLNGVFLTACIPGAGGMLDTLPMRSFPAEKIRTLTVEMDAGILNIKQAEDSMISFSGMAPVSQKTIPIETQGETTLSIQIPSGSSSESVYVLEIPSGLTLNIASNQGDIFLIKYQGTIDIDSTSGSISASDLVGQVTLRSGRGNIEIKNSTGEMHILGEHGILKMENLHGLLTSSTIMGNIQYLGSPAAGDLINLEVDHGPITAEVRAPANLQYSVQSASGEVNCSIPGVEFKNRGCSGLIGQGEAQLKIRSVSGKIILSAAQ